MTGFTSVQPFELGRGHLDGGSPGGVGRRSNWEEEQQQGGERQGGWDDALWRGGALGAVRVAVVGETDTVARRAPSQDAAAMGSK